MHSSTKANKSKTPVLVASAEEALCCEESNQKSNTCRVAIRNLLAFPKREYYTVAVFVGINHNR